MAGQRNGGLSGIDRHVHVGDAAADARRSGVAAASEGHVQVGWPQRMRLRDEALPIIVLVHPVDHADKLTVSLMQVQMVLFVELIGRCED